MLFVNSLPAHNKLTVNCVVKCKFVLSRHIFTFTVDRLLLVLLSYSLSLVSIQSFDTKSSHYMQYIITSHSTYYICLRFNPENWNGHGPFYFDKGSFLSPNLDIFRHNRILNKKLRVVSTSFINQIYCLEYLRKKNIYSNNSIAFIDKNIQLKVEKWNTNLVTLLTNRTYYSLSRN